MSGCICLNFSGLRTLKSVTPTLTLDFLEGHKFLIASAAFAESRQDFGGLGGLQLLLHSQQLSGFPFTRFQYQNDKAEALSPRQF